jgi:hypothetical protein
LGDTEAELALSELALPVQAATKRPATAKSASPFHGQAAKHCAGISKPVHFALEEQGVLLMNAGSFEQ